MRRLQHKLKAFASLAAAAPILPQPAPPSANSANYADDGKGIGSYLYSASGNLLVGVGNGAWRHRYAIGGGVCGTVLVVTLPIALGAAGFSAGGVVVGSWAAAKAGPVVAAGGYYALAQSTAAIGGLSAMASVSFVAPLVAVGAVFDALCAHSGNGNANTALAGATASASAVAPASIVKPANARSDIGTDATPPSSDRATTSIPPP